jgi:hypothetical protein
VALVTLTNALLRQWIEARFDRRHPEGVLGICGLRGTLPVGHNQVRTLGAAGEAPNLYNDTLVVFGPQWGLFRATVDPGSYYTEKPLSAHGCAHLKDGVWRYKIGTHRGHWALVQAAPVEVWRDRDRDHRGPEPGDKEETGYFGINIHAGASRLTVDQWSAGCQVLQSPWTGAPWLEFGKLIRRADADGQETFPYYLFRPPV